MKSDALSAVSHFSGEDNDMRFKLVAVVDTEAFACPSFKVEAPGLKDFTC